MSKKIGDFTNKANPDNNDLFLLEDSLDGSYKYSTKSQLLSGLGQGSSSSWKLIAADYLAIAGDKLLVNSRLNSVTITLPSNPNLGEEIDIAFIDVSPNTSLFLNLNNKLINKGTFVAISPSSFSFCTRLIYSTEEIGWISTNPEVIKGYGDITDEILADKPLLYFKLDETSGSVVNNIGSYKANGTYNAVDLKGNSLASGSKYSASFSGNNSQIIYNHDFSGTNFDLTVELFVNLKNNSLRGNFFKLGDGSNGIALGVGSGTSDNYGNDLIGLAENVVWVATNARIGVGTHLLGLTFTGNSKLWTFFIDGVKVYSTAANIASPASVGAIGSGCDDRFVNALIDEVVIHNRVLSDARIASRVGYKL